MKKILTLVALALLVGITPAYAFTLQDNSQCVGGTLLTTSNDVQDGGGLAVFINSKMDAQSWCSMITPPGACCSVVVSTNGAGFGGPVIPFTWFDYEIYTDATVQSGFMPNTVGKLANIPGTDTGAAPLANLGRQYMYFGGIADPAQAPTASLVANPPSITNGQSSLLSWTSTGATSCTGTNFATGGAVSGSVLVTPTATTQYSVTCTGAGGSATSNATVSVTDGSLQVSCQAHPLSAAIGEDVLWSSTVSGPQGTYTYAWNGTEGLTGAASQVFKRYTTQGLKTGSLTVTVTPAGTAGGGGGGQCPAGQVPVTGITGMSGDVHCSGGTVIFRDSDIGDGVSFGGNLQDILIADVQNADPAIPLGSCAELSFRSGNSFGGGFPPSSTWQIRVYSGATVVTGPSDYTNTLACMIGFNYTCGSMAGVVGTQCVPGGAPVGAGGTGTITKTVQCDNGVQVGPPECSDGIDNNGDGLVDAADPGCQTGTGTGTGGTYNPNGASEGGTGATAAQCSDGIDNNGDGFVDFPQDPGCSSLTDNLEQADQPDLVLTAAPPIIKKGQSCTLTVSARNVVSCTLSGPGISKTFNATASIIRAVEIITPILSQTSAYTLSCTGVSGRKLSKAIDCKVAPTFEEF